MEDNEIIELFWNRSEDAINQIDIKYGRLCLDLAHGILNNTADSEECVNDTYLAVWNAVPPTRPLNLRAFICRITRNLSLKRLEYNTAAKRCPDILLSLSEIGEAVQDSRLKAGIEDDELAVMVSTFLRTVKPEVRQIFVRRYFFFDSVTSIAARYGYSESKVKTMLYRTRNQLREYLRKEGIII